MSTAKLAVLLTTILGSLCLTGTVMAATHEPVHSLDFVNHNESLRVYVHSNQVIPHLVLERSPSRVVFELEGVKPEDSPVLTNYTQASNIQSVSVRALGSDRLRFTIKGERLSEPIIGFREIAETLPASAQQQPVLPELLQPKQQQLPQNPESPAASASLNKESASSPSSVAAKASVTIPTQAKQQTSSSAISKSSKAQFADKTASASGLTLLALAVQEPNMLGSLWERLTVAQKQLIQQVVMVSALLLVLGLFLALKLKSLRATKAYRPIDPLAQTVGKPKPGLAFAQTPATEEEEAASSGRLSNWHNGSYASSLKQGATKPAPGALSRAISQYRQVNTTAPLAMASTKVAAPIPASKAPTANGSAKQAKARLLQQRYNGADAVVDKEALKQQTPSPKNTKTAASRVQPPSYAKTPANRAPQPASIEAASPDVMDFLKNVAERLEQQGDVDTRTRVSALKRSINAIKS